jgi:hypothetical protein
VLFKVGLRRHRPAADDGGDLFGGVAFGGIRAARLTRRQPPER